MQKLEQDRQHIIYKQAQSQYVISIVITPIFVNLTVEYRNRQTLTQTQTDTIQKQTDTYQKQTELIQKHTDTIKKQTDTNIETDRQSNIETDRQSNIETDRH